MKRIEAEKLTRAAFAPFGDVIETEGAESFLINAGKCRRFHDLATVEAAGENARVLMYDHGTGGTAPHPKSSPESLSAKTARPPAATSRRRIARRSTARHPRVIVVRLYKKAHPLFLDPPSD